MGVYYYFINTRTKERNEKPIPGFGQCSWVAKLEYMENIEQIFKSVIEINPDWLATDIIRACPDYEYHTIIVYENGNLTYETMKIEDVCYESEEQYNGY